MTPTSLHERRFLAYEDSATVPNIVVDGAPNDATVLAISHWPGIPTPPGLGADLSVQMVFAYLDQQPDHAPAEVVTNNHFDQDGLAGLFALVSPDEADRHRDLLVDLAAAGDFGTYRHRASARASMIVAAYGDAERSPVADQIKDRPYPEQVAVLYEEALPLTTAMLTEPDRFRDLWAEEDEALTEGEQAIIAGQVAIDQDRALDLAVITVPEALGGRGGHRFVGQEFPELHPMAVQNATDCVRLLLVQGRRYRYVDRYETWVQYRSRELPRRVDLQPLAERLTAREPGSVRWRATPPSSLTPMLACDEESALDPVTVRNEIADHLREAPAAWDPYRLKV